MSEPPAERVIDWMRRRAENGADLVYALGQLEQAENAARSTPAEALDVPTLARALAAFRIIDGEDEGKYVHLVYDGGYRLADPKEFAERLAAEYARLRSPESDEAR